MSIIVSIKIHDDIVMGSVHETESIPSTEYFPFRAVTQSLITGETAAVASWRSKKVALDNIGALFTLKLVGRSRVSGGMA